MAWLLYVLALVILFYFWRKVRGLWFEDLLERSTREHKLVRRVHAQHPRGGTWREFRLWMETQEQNRK